MQVEQVPGASNKTSYPESIICILSKTYISHIGWTCTVVYLIYTLLLNGDYKILMGLILFSALTTFFNFYFKTVSALQKNLVDANTKICILEKEKTNLEKNRDALIEILENHKKKAIHFENAYATAKISIHAIIRANRITKDKDSILKVFDDIEQNQREDIQSE